MKSQMISKWPKQLPNLSAEQLKIKDDFMKYWHEVLPKKYGAVEKFNHGYPAGVRKNRTHITTLEIGAGIGEHLNYEDLNSQDYHVVELRENMVDRLKDRFPKIHAAVGDCQTRLPYDDNTFDRVLAIHVLEHLPNLPAALDEIYRVLKPDAQFTVVIPCEGGLAYSLARQISAKPIFEKRYQQSYDWFIKSEHINFPSEILDELKRRYRKVSSHYFPLRVPLVNPNLCIGIDFTKS